MGGVRRHCYAILDVFQADGGRKYYVKIFNPWGENGIMNKSENGISTISWDNFIRAFYYIHYNDEN